jgi:hypothetical protein
MEFCPMCNNMFYIRSKPPTEETAVASIEYYCKNCAFIKEPDQSKKSICIASMTQSDRNMYASYINPHIRYDPTLPRVDNIVCPNGVCTKPASESNRVIYLKYDYNNLKFLYNCEHCGHFWTL